ncbi:LysR family transcriptional regulator [Sphingobium sp. Sx8-8]|uniref:LysR family transcriptional regulator n=1 Tax=Sphingobium sp. Sx8-8 TaxID=2933617 RepID=UPI001F5836C6|nr:LysR family transcriptional regulator [Sphingobium sp. Sx8-8]
MAARIIDPVLAINFALVVEAGSITAGAAMANVPQPWMSTQMKKLEHLVGEKLLDRSSRHMELTEAGRRLLPFAQALLDADRAMQAHLAKSRASSERMIRLGAPHYTIGDPDRNRLLAQMIRHRPDLHIDVLTGHPQELFRWLRSGVIDCVFTVVNGYDTLRDVRIARFERRFAYALLPRGDPLASAPSIRLADLAGRDLVIAPDHANARSRRISLAPFERAGVKFVMAPDENRQVIESFAAQLGLPCLRWSYGRDQQRDQGEQRCLFIEEGLTIGMALFCRSDDTRLKVRHIMNCVAEVAQPEAPAADIAVPDRLGQAG